VEGIAETCRAFGTPVVGGNVSLYNESPAGVVDPTPTVAMVGLIEKEEHITTQFFKAPGDVIILVGPLGSEMGASRFLKVCHGRKEGRPPRLDIELEQSVQNSVRDLIRSGLVRSAHDCSEGGLAVAIAECCFNPQNQLGAKVKVNPSSKDGTSALGTLFSEAQSRILISVAPENLKRALQMLADRKVPHAQIGTVGTDTLEISVGSENYQWPIAQVFDAWWNAIGRAVEQDESIPSL